MSTDDFEVVEARRVSSEPSPPRRVRRPPPGPASKRRLAAVVLAVAAMAVGVGLWVRGTAEVATAVATWRGRLPVPEVHEGPLSGLVVYVSPGHGWLLHRENHDGLPVGWGSQRPETHGLIEDLWTAEFVADELAPALEAEGATVISLRERDRNPQRVVVDDGDAGYASTGALQTVEHGLGLGGDHQQLAAHGGALWWLEVPEDGHWYVYARWLDAAEHDDRAVFTVTAGDQVREVVVDQRHHGGHWWPLGDLCLPGGTRVEVALTGSGAGLLSADAVRMGGGTEAVYLPHEDEVVVLPTWQLAVAHQLEHLGGPPEIGRYACGAPVSDMRVRGHWTSWARPEGEDAVFLSVHTNATDGGATEGLMVFAGIDSDPPTDADPVSVELAHHLERSVLGAVRQREPGFRTHGVKLGDFSEISPVHNQVPGALLELGFHDSATDAQRLKDRRFREAAARGIVDGLKAWRGDGS